ncbi:hypothetical protein GE09DRAFT_1191992 [Coniochaeta sp. 2T2.1]|nr:hypothetical protein GE09DRAFT_1191992 [Coniochaeta sp. 2T2.1]
MAPNGQAYLTNPSQPEGPTRFSQARIAPSPTTHKTIYISGTACVKPDGTWEGVTENADGTRTLDIREQTAAVLRNVDTIIKGADLVPLPALQPSFPAKAPTGSPLPLGLVPDHPRPTDRGSERQAPLPRRRGQGDAAAEHTYLIKFKELGGHEREG